MIDVKLVLLLVICFSISSLCSKWYVDKKLKNHKCSSTIHVIGGGGGGGGSTSSSHNEGCGCDACYEKAGWKKVFKFGGKDWQEPFKCARCGCGYTMNEKSCECDQED